MQFAYGSYTGDGADNRQITGVGFQPDMVWVRKNASSFLIVRTKDMPADSARAVDLATWGLQANWIQSLDADGFTVGDHTDVNLLDAEYHWFAFKGDGLATGHYTGDGTSPRNITGLGFQPAWVAVLPDVAIRPVHKFLHTGQEALWGAHEWDNAPENNQYILHPFLADGFTVDNDQRVNQGDSEYYWFAFKEDAALGIYFGVHLGNGLDNHDITGIGFMPELVWIHEWGGGTTYLKTPACAGELTIRANAGTNMATGGIKTILADGFRLGTQNEVNELGWNFEHICMKNVSLGPAGIAAVNEVAAANINKVNKVAWAGIAKVDEVG